MNFTEAMKIIKNIVPESSANEYDGIIVKRLEASNTLDEGRTTNQTHIAISGEQMNMFPYLMADGYFKCDYNDRDEKLKKYFITQIPLYIYKDNIRYLADGEDDDICFDDEQSRCVCASIVRSRRKDQADQVRQRQRAGLHEKIHGTRDHDRRLRLGCLHCCCAYARFDAARHRNRSSARRRTDSSARSPRSGAVFEQVTRQILRQLPRSKERGLIKALVD